MNLIVIFFLFAYFGCLCLSGGSSLLQFYIDELVVARQWMTLEGLGNLMAISQVTPGPIGVNLATFLGYTQGGFWGGLLATVGLLTPSYILMSLAVKSYTKWHDSRFVRSLMYTLKPMTPGSRRNSSVRRTRNVRLHRSDTVRLLSRNGRKI